MTDGEWNTLYEQLRPILKQGFEEVAERGKPVVSTQIGRMQMIVAPGIAIDVKLFCFIAQEAAAAILQGTIDGMNTAAEISTAQAQAVMANQPRIIQPGLKAPRVD